MSRFLVWSDLHLNCWKYGAQVVDGRNSRLVDQQNVIAQMIGYGQANDIRLAFFCGDFFHTHSRVDTEVLRAAYESLEQLKTQFQMIFVVGNHDMSTKDGSIHSLDLLKNYGPVVDKPMDFSFGGFGLQVHAMPYTESEEDLIRFFRRCTPNSVALIHQGVANVPVGSKGFVINELLKPEMVPPSVLCFAGHYHDPCKVSDNLVIPGAPLQFNWSDKNGRRGWLDVFTGEEIQMSHIESNAPKFVETTEDKLDEFPYDGNFCRIQVNTANSQEIRDRLKGAISVELSVQASSEPKIEDKGFDTVDTLFDEFVSSRKLDDKTVKIGRDLMSNRYAPIKSSS